MSRNVNIYGLQYELMRTHLPELMKHDYSFDQEIEWDKKTILEKTISNTHLLSEQEIDKIHHWLLSYSFFDIKKTSFIEAEVGFVSLYETGVTWQAVTFMELWQALLPELTNPGDFKPAYLCTRLQLSGFLEKLLVLAKIFFEYDEGVSIDIEGLDPETEKNYTPYAKTKLMEEIQKRERMGEDYVQKWNPQYFHLLANYDHFEELRRSVLLNNFDCFLLIDSV